MSPRERVLAALRGETVDRPPVSFWGHFFHRESSAADLAQATLEAQNTYAWDWIKLNPRKHYHVEPWGVSYRYSGKNQKPAFETWPIHQPDDWKAIVEKPHDQGALGEQIEAVRLVRQGLGHDVPLIQTIFTPLGILNEMVEKPAVLRAHIDSHPDLVRAALEAVTRTFEKYAADVIAAGADGLFYATTYWGTRDYITADELRTWSRPYDERILAVASKLDFNVLHVCKSNNLLYEFADYPVHAFSWASTDPTNPTLGDALQRLKGAVMGGISQDGALTTSGADRALAEFREGLEQTGGRRWLVAPGCSIPPDTPPPILKSLREAVETTRLSGATRGDPSASGGGGGTDA